MEGSVSVSDIVQTVPDSIVSRESTQFPVGSTVPANSAELQEAGLRSLPASLPVSVFPTVRDEDESSMFDAHVSPARDTSENGRVADFAEPGFRRLRLISQGARVPHVSRSVGAFDESMQDIRGSDSVGTLPVNEASSGVGSSVEETDSIDGREESVEGDDAMVDIPLEDPVEMDFPRAGALREGLESLDLVDVRSLFENRASVFKSVPKFLHGPFRNALKFALEECLSLEVLRQERGWKLLTLIPRMLLHRPPGGGLIPKSKLLGRFEAFSRGEFNVLLMSSEDCDKKAAVSRRRRHRTGGLDLERRALRAETLIQMGELSSARQALEGADLAKGDRRTLGLLTDVNRRPDRPRDPIPEELTAFEPMAMFDLDEQLFARNVRSSRRGAAGGLSGMTTEHLRPLTLMMMM